MLYFTSELADIVYVENIQTVEIKWKQDLKDTNKYFLIQSKAFALLKDKNCIHWLSDLRAKKNLSIEETEWLRKYMLPQAIENEVSKVAFVVNDEDSYSIRKEAIIKVTKDKINLKFFLTQEDAHEWFENSTIRKF